MRFRVWCALTGFLNIKESTVWQKWSLETWATRKISSSGQASGWTIPWTACFGSNKRDYNSNFRERENEGARASPWSDFGPFPVKTARWPPYTGPSEWRPPRTEVPHLTAASLPTFPTESSRVLIFPWEDLKVQPLSSRSAIHTVRYQHDLRTRYCL